MVSIELAEPPSQGQTLAAQNQSAKVLVLKHAIPEGDARDFRALDEADKTILLTGVEDLRFAYFGQDNDQTDPTWRDKWSPGSRVPVLMRIELKLSAFREPREMLLALHLGEEAGCYQSSFQRQCGARR